MQSAVCRKRHPCIGYMEEIKPSPQPSWLASYCITSVTRQKGLLSSYVNVDDMCALCTMRQRVSFSYYSGYPPYGHIIITATFFILAKHSFIFYKKSPLMRLSFYSPVNS